MFDTSDNSLMVYIFGPLKSRPYTVCVHTMVGVGFVSGTLLCSPFLPEQSKTSEDVCPSIYTNETLQHKIDVIAEVKGKICVNLCPLSVHVFIGMGCTQNVWVVIYCLAIHIDGHLAFFNCIW